MSKERENRYVDTLSPRALVAASFATASGSLQVHSFFMRGYALAKGIDTQSAIDQFSIFIDNFTEHDIRALRSSEEHYHDGNKHANDAVNYALDELKLSELKLIKDTLPDSEEDAEHLSRYPIHQIENTLKKIWGSENLKQIIEDTKDFAAYAGLFTAGNTPQWYKHMNGKEKYEMFNKGQKIFRDANPDILELKTKIHDMRSY